MKRDEQEQDQQIRKLYKKAQLPGMVKEQIEETLRSLDGQGQTRERFYKRKRRGKQIFLKRAAAVAAAAVFCVGGTAFAASRIYQMHLQKEQTYQASLHITSEEAVPQEVAEVEIKVNYLPDGFAPDPDKGMDYYYTNPQIENVGYYLETPLLMDEADPLTVLFVKEAQSLTINEHAAAYINEAHTLDKDWNFGTLYVVYEEVNRVLPIHMWGYADQQELQKIAENIELLPTGSTVSSEDLLCWSEAVAAQNEPVEIAAEEENIRRETDQSGMANVHQVGDIVSVRSVLEAGGEEVRLEASLTDVQVADDLSLLSREELIPEEWKELIGPDGKLLPDTRNYIKWGNGVDTLDEILRTEASPVKLVYVTAEYTNNSDRTLENVMYYVTLSCIEQEGNRYTIYEPDAADCDTVQNEHMTVGTWEMSYYDVTGGSRNNNYIPEIKPGETKTVHLAWMVNEDELDKLYLDFLGSGDQFTEESLETGLVELALF